ncbi:hypothetical protein EDC04DRAFT_2957879 [Pisolithus marmoratus]|nr:hypothetical protein EDC04DRAFT_2957879 [Pisolithus marmoratus]
MSHNGQEPEPHHEHRAHLNAKTRTISDIDTKLANPLRGIPYETLMIDVEEFARDKELSHLLPQLRKGVLVAQDLDAYQQHDMFTATDRKLLQSRGRSEVPLSIPIMLFLAAITFGMDETVINGAQLSYPKQFGIDTSISRDSWLLGFINAAPYLCCVMVSCWLTHPLNQWLGWKRSIFVAYFISSVACIWSAVTNTWWHLLISRFFLGFGIGPGLATTLLYLSECYQIKIPDRLSFVSAAQVAMLIGRLCGDIVALAFHFIPDSGGIKGLNWRLTLVSPGVPGGIICLLGLFTPESPRWLIAKGRYKDAFDELCRLRTSDFQAAGDLYYIHILLEAEREVKRGRNRLLETFTIPRNRNAMIASWIIIFGQQFCGVNVITRYSSTIFSQSGFSAAGAVAATLGVGYLNMTFGWSVCLVINKLGRRSFLLFTFPCVMTCLLITSFSFWDTLTQGRLAGVTIGIYVFTIFSSPGEPSVPFTYPAEALPLYIRDIGISFAIAAGWFWKFMSSVTWPFLSLVFKPQGAFGWYAAWCMIFWVLTLLFVRETKNKTPDELHQAFSVPILVHTAHVRRIQYAIEKFILLRNPTPERLCEREDTSDARDYALTEMHQNTVMEP